MGKSPVRKRPLGPYSGPAAQRPKSETPLLVWFRASGLSVMEFSREIGADPKSVYHWMYGQVIPEVVYAFKIEAVTRGGCPVESWLGTELAKMQWQNIHADLEGREDHHRRAQRKYEAKLKKEMESYGQDTSEG